MSESAALILLSSIVFLPALVAVLLAFAPRGSTELMKFITAGTTIVVFVLTLASLFLFDVEQGSLQQSFVRKWIPSFKIDYFMGMDGISLPLVVLTSFICVLAMIASWSINQQVKAYCMLFLLLETGMLGVFVSLDFFLFYVFWEVMLLPMYFLIGVWGGPRKEYAAIKFFLYTLFGSVLMLIAILMLYFASDLGELARVKGVSLDELRRELHISADVMKEEQQPGGATTLHTFNILALAEMGQRTDLFNDQLWLGWTLQQWAFLLLFIGFVIKVPSVPVHTWLPDAHVEAPTPISMILAGILLKMGGYGILRICYPICPDGGHHFMWMVCLIGVVSMVYGAFAAMAQTDFKRLVAYSSVSHMGYVVLGMGVWSAAAPHFNSDYWNMGINGAMFQMIAHGISSAGMFFLVGVVYDRVHHRNIWEFGGLYGRMPVYTALAVIIFFAALGLPGLCGFWGEVFVVLSAWQFDRVVAIVSASVVILTAGYILWTIQRVYLGPEYKGPHGEALSPITRRELSVAVPLAICAVWFGVYPNSVLRYMDRTIHAQAQRLSEWTRDVKFARHKAQAQATAHAVSALQRRTGGVTEGSGHAVSTRGQQIAAPPIGDAASTRSADGSSFGDDVQRSLPSAQEVAVRTSVTTAGGPTTAAHASQSSSAKTQRRGPGRGERAWN